VLYDGIHRKNIIGVDTKVTLYSKVIINDVTNIPYLALEIEPVAMTSIDQDTFLQVMSETTGVDADKLFVKFEVDEKGMVKRVMIYMNLEEKEAKDRAKKICNCDNESECNIDIGKLNVKARNCRIHVNGESMLDSSSISEVITLIVMMNVIVTLLSTVAY